MSPGQAEIAVKTAKRIVNGNTGPQGSLNNDNVAQAILQNRNTSIKSISLSLAWLLLHRRLWDSIPSQPILYKSHPEWVAAAQRCEEILHYRNAKIVEKYNKYTHNHPPLQAGDTVAIQNPLKDGTRREKSSQPDPIANTESELTDQERLHLGNDVSSKSVNSSLHQPQYQVQHQDQ